MDGLRAKGRGGILGFGSTLAKQSGASRTSPILRGNWLSEVVLGEKLPRPPKGVPILPEEAPQGLADAIPPGGYLVYTGQPWHPQLELIARALTSHRQGQAWVMRRRTQAEMDQLVAAAGFRKVAQRIDEWGIFSVSLAQRVAA